MGERLRIVDVPPGQAPEWVRREWVGLELPIDESVPEDGIQFGVEGGEAENIGGHPVLASVAISTLREKSPQAADWWESHLLRTINPRLVFKTEVCEVLSDPQ